MEKNVKIVSVFGNRNSGQAAAIVFQKNGIIRVARVSPKRKRKKTVPRETN